MAVRGAHVQPVDSGPRARHDPGHLLRRRPPGGRAHAARCRRPAAVSAVARDLRLLRPGGIPLGRGLAHLVPQRSLGASRRQCRGARAHRRRTSAGQSALHRLGLLGKAAAGSEHRGLVRDVRLERGGDVLLHHVAADLPAGASRLRSDQAGVLRGAAAARERAERSVRRLRHGQARRALWISDRPLRPGRRRLSDFGCGADRRGAVSHADRRGRDDRAGDGVGHVHPRRGLEHLHRDRPQSRRRRRRDDEHLRADRQPAVPADRRLLGPVVWQLELSALPAGRAVSPRGGLLADCRSAAPGVRACQRRRSGE